MPSKKDATSPKPAEVAVERPLLYEVLEQSPAMPASPKKAVLITHGMGQQKEFETLNQVVAGLRRAAEASGGTLRQKVRFVQIGQERLYRVELELQSQGKKQEVDLYEAYWAPLTEGNVSLRDVVRFLWSAGVSGILNFFHPPTQQRFGQQVPMPPTRKTLGHLLLALVLLLSLIVMNASIIAVGAARSVFTNESAWLSEALFSDLSVIFNILLIFVVPTGAVLMLASIRKAAGAPDQGGFSPAGRRLTWTYLCLTGAATVILGLWNLAVLVADRPRSAVMLFPQMFPEVGFLADLRAAAAALGLASLILGIAGYRWRWTHVTHGLILFVCLIAQGIGLFSMVCLFVPGLRFGHHQLLSLLLPERWTFLRLGYWLWPLLILVAAQIRTLMVQYVGDVSAYVSPDKLDRFSDIREKIKGRVRQIAAAVYSAQALDGGGFEYGQVALVGHSLGSVISYDTLNRLLKDDEVAGNPRDILGRTALLLTFGSPLDKTAFVFALHGKEATETREALVASVQPLIQDYRYRPFPWVNIWSPNDVISGRLDYFDAIPPEPNHCVQNEADPEATIPLVAHTEYWKNRLVWEKLYAALV